MEKTHTGKAHGHAVLVCGLNHMVIADGAARLRNIVYAGFAGTFHVVTEGEEGITAAGHAALRGNPGLFLFRRQHLGPRLEDLLPDAVREHILKFIGGVDVNRVIPIRATDSIDEIKAEHFRVLAQIPVVRFASGKASAVNSALLFS